ncbi:MAG: aminopeptidase P family protein [Nitrososphaerota archaeon]|jgi:Xaa-Pro dipeptidase|nr:aminopeptidase P family protein [Nitrososphaerota archaeon]
MSDSGKRVKKIFSEIDNDLSIKKKPRALILWNGVAPHADSSLFYVTGIPYGLFEGSILVAERNDGITLITSPLEESIARENASKDVEIFIDTETKAIESRLRKTLGNKSSVIGLNSPELSYKSFLQIKSIFRGSEFIDVSSAFESARLVKDSGEIEKIQTACNIASRVYKNIPAMLKYRVPESTIAAKMAYEMQELGGSGVSFDSIVAFGKNSALPHYSAGNGKLSKGQFVLCDYGSKYQMYCSDITRTLVFGTASKKQKRMYEVVRTALEMGRELCVAENAGDYVHNKVAEYIDSTEFKGRFIHSLGHSLGMNVHDGPGLSKRNKRKLLPGMVVTVEPGVYLPGFGGIRIEDDVLITKGKPKVLTSATRELIEV